MRGIVLSGSERSFRVVPASSTTRPIEIAFVSMHAMAKVSRLVAVGDEIEAVGWWKDGLLYPERLHNLRTDVPVLRRSKAGGYVILAIMLVVDVAMAVGLVDMYSRQFAPDRDAFALFAFILFVLTVLVAVGVLRGDREPKEMG